MAHLNDRFCMVPFHDLADGPSFGHHAIGSPYFDAEGRPLYPDPIVISVHTDIIEERLPRCTALAVSCNTKPYHSYGPVMQRVFEKSRPHDFDEVRQGLEGVMEIGGIRRIPSGGLANQTEEIILACITPMTGRTSNAILTEVVKCMSEALDTMPGGATIRMPIIGTGKASQDKSTEQNFKDVVNLTIQGFTPALLVSNERIPPRRLLLVHPLDYESYLINTVLAEKAAFLSILDKLGVTTADRRLIFGMAYDTDEQERLKAFNEAIEHFDHALNLLLKGEHKEALQEAAKGAQVEPDLRGMYIYIASLAQKKGLLDAVARQAVSLAESGTLREAYGVSQALLGLDGKSREKKLIASIAHCYSDYCVAALEARLLYENYMHAEETLKSLETGMDIFGSKPVKIPKGLLADKGPLQYLHEKIPLRIIENTFHIVIRKFMSDHVEIMGARRSLDNLLELQQHDRIKLDEKEKNICDELYKMTDFIEHNIEKIPQYNLQKDIMEKMLKILPEHGTLRLEASRHYLKGEKNKNRAQSLTRLEVEQAWQLLSEGYQQNPRDYGILAYIGFLILLQGQKYLNTAEEFFMLFGKLVDNEFSHGKFGIRKLQAPQRQVCNIAISDSHTKKAHKYYDEYHSNAEIFMTLAKSIRNSEASSALALYKRAMHSLQVIGRSDLVDLYDNILGETWVALLCRNQQQLGTIPLPFGEISLDFLFNTYRKIRRWWKYKNLKSKKVRGAVSEIIQKMGKQVGG